jgi:cytidylate kinase
MAVVTISRQVGSYGDEIAALVAESLHYRLIGRDEFHEMAEAADPEFKKAFVQFESAVEPRFFERFFFQNPAYTSLFESITYDLAGTGDVVILGRGAQVVLQESPGVFKARIVAPLETRVRRVMEKRRVSLEEASDFVSRYDHQRKAIIQSIYLKDLSDWYLYDMILNTGWFPPQAGATILLQAIGSMAPVVKQEERNGVLRNMAFAKRVECEIKKWLLTSPYRQIQVGAAANGAVTLSGYVQNPDSRDLAERIALRVAGVTGVENRLRITEIRV